MILSKTRAEYIPIVMTHIQNCIGILILLFHGHILKSTILSCHLRDCSYFHTPYLFQEIKLKFDCKIRKIKKIELNLIEYLACQTKFKEITVTV